MVLAVSRRPRRRQIALNVGGGAYRGARWYIAHPRSTLYERAISRPIGHPETSAPSHPLPPHRRAEKLRDLRILALRKITVKVDPAFATLTINVPPSRLTATLDDGHALRASSIACRVSQDGR